MARNRIEVAAPADVVWAVLGDARRYADFVVGTKVVRRFDPRWPEDEATLHHSVGIGPFVLRDATRVIKDERPARLRLQAGLRPLVVNEVTFDVEPLGASCARVHVEERPVGGPVRSVWNPAIDALMWMRNHELLRRLKRLAEQRARLSAATRARRLD